MPFNDLLDAASAEAKNEFRSLPSSSRRIPDELIVNSVAEYLFDLFDANCDSAAQQNIIYFRCKLCPGGVKDA